MAPLTRRRKRALDAAAPAIDPADRLSKLPDEILEHIMSFLSSQEAVQTCVLARTWRNHWKSTKRLHITVTDVYMHKVVEFVDGLLRARVDGLDSAPLHACEITVKPTYDEDEDDKFCLDDDDWDSVNDWIRRVLECKVQTLRVDILAQIMPLEPLASRHLARLELKSVSWTFKCIDLSSCPALEYLEITESPLDLEKMTSPSLKRLVIRSCGDIDNNEHCTVQLCFPRLVSLWLEVTEWTALLDRMPDLVGAHVEFGFPQHCEFGFSQYCDFDIKSERIATNPYLLEGLAEAKDIVMTADDSMSVQKIFTSYLKLCPTFSKLKTLVLNDLLCEPDDCTIACILEHAPVLEKFTFIFSGKNRGKYKLEVKGHLDETVKPSTMSLQLKRVEVKCEMIDERVLNFLKFFGTLNICFQIRVTE